MIDWPTDPPQQTQNAHNVQVACKVIDALTKDNNKQRETLEAIRNISGEAYNTLATNQALARIRRLCSAILDTDTAESAHHKE